MGGNGLAVARRHALSVPIGLRLGLSPASLPITLLPGANELPMGEMLGESDDDDVVVGTGDAVVLGGEEEFGSWFSGVNNAPGVVI